MTDTASRSRWAGIPAEDRRAARRERLLDAAFELLGTDGWDATTVRSVCLAAQLNHRYFYESFEDLDALLVAVYDRTVEELAAAAYGVATAAGDDDPEVRLRAILRRIVDFIDEDRRRGRVLYMEALGNEALNLRRIAAGRALVDLLVLGAAGHYGEPPKGERIGRIVAALAVGGFSELLSSWLDGRLDISKRQLVDDTSALFIALGEAAGKIAEARGAGRSGGQRRGA